MNHQRPSLSAGTSNVRSVAQSWLLFGTQSGCRNAVSQDNLKTPVSVPSGTVASASLTLS